MLRCLRAEIELLGETGQPVAVLFSGELIVVRVKVRFCQAVARPVVGLLLRSPFGMNVSSNSAELDRPSA